MVRIGSRTTCIRAYATPIALFMSWTMTAAPIAGCGEASPGEVGGGDPSSDEGQSGRSGSSGRSGLSGSVAATGSETGVVGGGTPSGASGTPARSGSTGSASGSSGRGVSGASGALGRSGSAGKSGSTPLGDAAADAPADYRSDGSSGTDTTDAAKPDVVTTIDGCDVSPVDPKATPEARRLLCYLYSIYGKKVLSGQQVTGWGDADKDVTWYKDKVGKYPAVLGDDFLYNGVTERVSKYWRDGSIVMIRYHMGIPGGEDSYQSSMKATNCRNVTTPGTTEYDAYVKNRLGHVADVMLKLQEAKVPVLMALFHEVQPNGWFWWSKCSNDEFNALWKLSYDYLTNVRGIHNMVRLLPYSGSPNSGRQGPYPGKEQVDIAGGDTYGSDQPFPGLYNEVRRIVGDKMPIPLHETGKVVQPDAMFPTKAPWLLWNIWCGMEWDPKYNTDDEIRRAYASSFTITRDEVPDLK